MPLDQNTTDQMQRWADKQAQKQSGFQGMNASAPTMGVDPLGATSGTGQATDPMQSWYTDYLHKQTQPTESFGTTGYEATTLNPNDLTKRVINPSTETVAGRMNSLMSEDSPYLQSARARSAGAMNARGLMNSSIAIGDGERAAYDAAMPIAQADASAFGKASDYNTTLANQGMMYNADALNKTTTARMGIDADLLGKQKAIDAGQAGQFFDAQSRSALASQQSREDLAAKTALTAQQADADYKSKIDAANIQAASQRYSTDSTTAQNATKDTTTLANNIIQNTELAPDIKAGLLKALGRPELASAIYVVDSVAGDLAPSGGGGAGASTIFGGFGGATLTSAQAKLPGTAPGSISPDGNFIRNRNGGIDSYFGSSGNVIPAELGGE